MSSSVSDLIRAVVFSPSSRHSSRSGRCVTILSFASTLRTDCSSRDGRPPKREMMDCTQEQRCAGYCLGTITSALTLAAICKNWRISEMRY